MGRLLIIAIWAGLGLARFVAAEPVITDTSQPVAATMIGDAALADVCFVNRSCGWAVGERGVIWHTIDGGASWREQPSGVKCRLNSVCFLDERHGWVVGGATRPATSMTQGVVLRTVDGGQTWLSMPNLVLPGLSRVHFFSSNDGIAIGGGSSFFPSGVFATRDGGREWQALPCDRTGYWLAGDFLATDTGAVAGAEGQFATVARGKVTPSQLSSPSARSFHALRLVAPIGGWMVGDGGILMTTSDLGKSWQTPSENMPVDVFSQFDFRTVALRGRHVWVAGSPGTRVFHSSDAGQNWQMFATGQTVPINALTFVDELNGWAVGELGSILATQDGGQTWQLQRAGGRRAALLAVFADAIDLPLELVADQGAAEGYLTAIEILHPAIVGDGPAVDASISSRVRDAIILAGATSAHSSWRFPLPAGDAALAPEDLIDKLNRATDGRALELLNRHLVSRLRMWRPDVVVVQHAAANGDRPITGLVEQLVLNAIEAAADPAQSPALSSDAQLTAWQVQKVYGVLSAEMRGDEVVSASQFSARLGSSPIDWTAPARHLVTTTSTAPPETIQLRLLIDRTSHAGGPRGLFSGISLPPGGEARRPTANDVVGDADILRRLAVRRRNLRELLERSEGNAAWIGHVDRLVDGLDESGGGELLFQLADGYRASGRFDLAADTFYLLARRYPNHPLTDPALVWLVQFYASGEAARRSTGENAVALRPANPDERRDIEPQVKQASAELPVGANSTPAVGLSRDDRLQRAVQLGEYLEASRPLLFPEPALRFPLVAAHRQLGFANPAKRYFLTLGQLPTNDPWRRCAETEQWLSKPSELPPSKVLGHCRIATNRPHLDGKLDELFWQTADMLLLRGRESLAATERSKPNAFSEVREFRHPTVCLAHDAEFLYLAIRCPKDERGDYQPDDRPRPRDADLAEHDRVALRLDVDRDFTTWFELIVDHRGWTHDSCWGDSHWDPAWYVAAADDPAAWTVEAAIPLADLVAEPPQTKDVWAISVRRTVPGAGHQSWADNATDADSPDQFGFLIFE